MNCSDWKKPAISSSTKINRSGVEAVNSMHIAIEAELIRPDPDKVPVGVTVVIETAVGGLTIWERIPIALANGVLQVSAWLVRRRVRSLRATVVKGSVAQGVCHQHQPKIRKKMKATVTSNSGSAIVSPGGKQINQGGFVNVMAFVVTVCGASSKCSYTVEEIF